MGTARNFNGMPQTTRVSRHDTGRVAWHVSPLIVLVAGGAVATACILGGVAAGGRIAGGASPRLAAAAYALCIAVPLIGSAIVAGIVTAVPAMRAERGVAARLFGWGALGAGGVALAAWMGGMLGAVTAHDVAPGAVLLVGMALCALQSTAEEVFLRGWLQPALARWWPAWAAIVATALLFAGLHMLAGQRTPLSLLNLAFGGIVFGILAARTRGLAAPIGLHAGWNMAEQFLFGLDPNPGIGEFGALLDLDLTGPGIWGGSGEGLNASLVMTAALVMLLVLSLAWRTRKAGA